MTTDTLRTVPLFESLDDQAAATLCDLLESMDCRAEQTLFRAGDAGNAMYLIEQGLIRISVKGVDGQEINVAELGSGDFFGEMAMLDGQPRSANATALEDSRLAILSRKHFMSFVQGNSEVALEMLSALAHRLRRTDELLQRRVARNVNEEEAATLTFADKAADVIAEFGGSWKFIISSIVFSLFWIGLNSWLLFDKGAAVDTGTAVKNRFEGFDPYPYVLLNLVIGMIASLSAPVIMMSQNRQSHKDRLRADMDYKVNLKNELTLSEILQRLHVMERDLSLTADQGRPNERNLASPPSAGT
jgi:CRP/FNR family cyclic AMP-dependent transcriptional regulator